MTEETFTYKIETLGCKANLTDSQYLEKRLQREGGSPIATFEEADVFIVNSCTVTDRADRDALGMIRRREGKGKIAVLTGCLAEVNPKVIKDSAFSDFDQVVLARNSGKSLLPTTIAEVVKRRSGKGDSREIIVTGERVTWHKEMDSEPGAALEGGGSQRTRAFFKVQDGCDQFCSYCIIPHARGRSRSLNPKEVVAEIKDFLSKGIKEVVLTAIHAADYDFDSMKFFDLVKYVLAETDLPRLRLTSLDPSEINSEIIDFMANEPRLCSHFHVSMQSASSSVLAGMKRHYDAERAESCLLEIGAKIPGAFIGMDMIAGFPGETDQHHQETMDRLRRTPWSRLHVFPFSSRRMTHASRMVEQGLGVPEEVKRQRAAELRALSEERLLAARERKVGSLVEVLTEAKPFVLDGKEFTQGRSRSYHRVLVPGKLPVNRLVRGRIESVGPRDTLLASLQ